MFFIKVSKTLAISGKLAQDFPHSKLLLELQLEPYYFMRAAFVTQLLAKALFSPNMLAFLESLCAL